MAFTQQTTGRFSPNPGASFDVIGQDFFDAAFAGRLAADPVYREQYNCNIIQQSNMGQWLEEYMGVETSCITNWSLIETHPQNSQFAVKTGVTIPVSTSTGTIAIASANHYVSGVYVLPQLGNTLVLPNGVFAEVEAINVSTANNTTVTVRLRDANASAQVLSVGDVIYVLSGSFIDDCGCPEGQFTFEDLPTVHELEMIQFGDKGSLCGDALNACQILKIPFTDDCGKEVDKWYTLELQNMYKRFEERKFMEKLLNPIFGIIPVIKAQGLNFQTASDTEITVEDINQWKLDLVAAGIQANEFAIFAGTVQYLQWQALMGTLGVTNLNYTQQPLGDCKWINLNWCGIKVAGLTLHIYEETYFSNGKNVLGGAGSDYSNASIIVPMWQRAQNCGGPGDNRMLTTVYFQSKDGRVWDNLTDSNGVLGVRNTFGTGCETQEWTIKTRFTQEIHCGNSWGYMRLP